MPVMITLSSDLCRIFNQAVSTPVHEQKIGEAFLKRVKTFFIRAQYLQDSIYAYLFGVRTQQG